MFLSTGGQFEEGLFPPEHWEENDQDWNKNSFCRTTREDQAEDIKLEGFPANIEHQEGTTQILTLHLCLFYTVTIFRQFIVLRELNALMCLMIA